MEEEEFRAARTRVKALEADYKEALVMLEREGRKMRGEVERGAAALKHARQEALETQQRAGAASEAVMVHARAAWGEETRRVVEEAERGASAKQEWVLSETQQRLAAMSGEKDRCVRKWRR